MTKAYSYIRFSSPEQAKGDSYRRQRQAAQLYCERNNLELATSREYTFFDRGRSGYKGEHLDTDGQLKRFIDYVENGDIIPGSYLLVENLDRLSREEVPKAFTRFIDLLNKGIRIVTLSNNRLYGENPNEIDLIISIIEMSRAYNESAIKSQRLQEAWAEKKRKAREHKTPLGRACPYWLELKDGEYHLLEDRVKIIKRIFYLNNNGKGATAICTILNKEGIEPFGSIGRGHYHLWSHSSITKIIKNKALIGDYQPTSIINKVRQADGPPIKDFFPKAISEEVFWLAQSKREERRITKTTKQSKNFNIWQGVSKCYLCGSSMHIVDKGKPPKGYKYIYCYNSQRGKCSNKPIRLDRSEIVFKEILAKIDSLSLVQDSSNAIRKRISEIEGKFQSTTNKLTETTESFKNAPSKTLAIFISELEKELEALKEDKNNQQKLLAEDKITSKNEFFEKLDLDSWEGRAAANSLLKRLGITAHILKQKRPKLLKTDQINYLIKQQNEEDITKTLFYIIDNSKNISFIAGNRENLDLIQEQGDIIYDADFQSGELH